MPKKTFFPLLLAVLALMLSACGNQETPTPPPLPTGAASETIIAEGRLVPARETTLRFAVRGPVEEILVEEGQRVQANTPLVRLGNRAQAEAALEAARADLTAAQQAYDQFIRLADQAKAQAWQDYMQAQIAREQAQADWDALDLEALRDKVDEKEADVRARKEDLNDAQNTFDTYADLDPNNPTRKQAKDDLDKARQAYNEAVAAWEAAQRAIDEPQSALLAAQAAEEEARRRYEDIRDNGFDSEQKDLLWAQLQAAQAQLAAAEEMLAQYTLTAPFTGTVARLDLTPGQYIGPETPAVQLADFSAWQIETTDLSELEIVHIQVGQSARLVPDALPELTLEGQVTHITPAYTTRSGDILYTVTISLPGNIDPRLRWGMTFEVSFP